MDKFLIKNLPKIPEPPVIPSKYATQTWLNLYGKSYCDFTIINVEEENKKWVELPSTVASQLEAALEMDSDHKAEYLLAGMRSFKAFIGDGRYPNVETTLSVLSVLKSGMTKDFDQSIIMEAFNVAQELVRYMPPLQMLFYEYWKIVLMLILSDPGEKIELTAMRLREKFVRTMSRLCDGKKKSENQELASNAFLKFLIDLLEIGFKVFLNKTAKSAWWALHHVQHAPCIALLFWPNMMVHISVLQNDFLKPIFQMLVSSKDMLVYDSGVRLLAMIFEMIRLTDKRETRDTVAFHQTPDLLRRFLTDLSSLFRGDVLKEIHMSTAFGWVKVAIEERRAFLNEK